jgi:hypothetical protein
MCPGLAFLIFYLLVLIINNILVLFAIDIRVGVAVDTIILQVFIDIMGFYFLLIIADDIVLRIDKSFMRGFADVLSILNIVLDLNKFAAFQILALL